MDATRLLDDPEQLPDSAVQMLEDTFRMAMINAYSIFRDHAFRKWPLTSTRLSPINRALFETWSIAVAELEPDDLKQRRDDIKNAARQRMTTDIQYLDAITSSTSDRRRVSYRFQAAQEDAGAGR